MDAAARKAVAWRIATAVIALATSLALHPRSAEAQSLEATIGSLAEENALLYLEPVSHGLSHAMTSALAESARPRRLLSFNVGMRMMAALPPDEVKSFTPVVPSQVLVPGVGLVQNPYGGSGLGTSPTAVGEGTGLVLEPALEFQRQLEENGYDPEDFRLVFPPGFDIPAIPFAVLEGALGVGMGTELNVRLIPHVTVEQNVGTVAAFGLGARHSLTSWLLVPVPLDIALSAGIQRFSAGEFLDARGRSAALSVSRTVGAITVFAEGGARTAQLDVDYMLENEILEDVGRRIEVSSELGTSGNLAAGVHLQLALVSISGQYSIAEYNTVSLRVGLGTPY